MPKQSRLRAPEETMPKLKLPDMVRYINSILQDKMLFGSHWLVITPDRSLSDFARLDIREESARR